MTRFKFNNKLIILILLVVVVFNSCRKYEVVKPTDIIFLGHKGAGSNNYNELNIENTLPAVKQGLEELDGVELDIEMSLDNTIYIYHNANLNDKVCMPTVKSRHIPKMRDSEIESVNFCHLNKKDRIYKLAEIFEYWNSRSRDFYISIDVKVSFGSGFFDEIGGRKLYLENLAAQLSTDLKSANNTDKLFIEFDSADFLKALKSRENTRLIKCCYIGDADIADHIEKSLRVGYDGISINYSKATKESVKEAKEKGLFVQIWSPYNKAQLVQAFAMNPDVIQTDNKYAKRILRVE